MSCRRSSDREGGVRPSPLTHPPTHLRLRQPNVGLRAVDAEQVGGGDVEVVVAVGRGEDTHLWGYGDRAVGWGRARCLGGFPRALYLLQQQHSAGLQLTLPLLQQQAVQRALHLPYGRGGGLWGVPGGGGMGLMGAGGALTGRVSEHSPGIDAAPAEAFDHHGHAGHFVPRELLQRCLHARSSQRCNLRGGVGGEWGGVMGQSSPCAAP